VTGSIRTLANATLLAFDPRLPGRGRPSRVLPLLLLGTIVRVAGALIGYAEAKPRRAGT
jgi:hypothetical protein